MPLFSRRKSEGNLRSSSTLRVKDSALSAKGADQELRTARGGAPRAAATVRSKSTSRTPGDARPERHLPPVPSIAAHAYDPGLDDDWGILAASKRASLSFNSAPRPLPPGASPARPPSAQVYGAASASTASPATPARHPRRESSLGASTASHDSRAALGPGFGFDSPNASFVSVASPSFYPTSPPQSIDTHDSFSLESGFASPPRPRQSSSARPPPRPDQSSQAHSAFTSPRQPGRRVASNPPLSSSARFARSTTSTDPVGGAGPEPGKGIDYSTAAQNVVGIATSSSFYAGVPSSPEQRGRSESFGSPGSSPPRMVPVPRRQSSLLQRMNEAKEHSTPDRALVDDPSTPRRTEPVRHSSIPYHASPPSYPQSGSIGPAPGQFRQPAPPSPASPNPPTYDPFTAFYHSSPSAAQPESQSPALPTSPPRSSSRPRITQTVSAQTTASFAKSSTTSDDEGGVLTEATSVEDLVPPVPTNSLAHKTTELQLGPPLDLSRPVTGEQTPSPPSMPYGYQPLPVETTPPTPATHLENGARKTSGTVEAPSPARASAPQAQQDRPAQAAVAPSLPRPSEQQHPGGRAKLTKRRTSTETSSSARPASKRESGDGSRPGAAPSKSTSPRQPFFGRVQRPVSHVPTSPSSPPARVSLDIPVRTSLETPTSAPAPPVLERPPSTARPSDPVDAIAHPPRTTEAAGTPAPRPRTTSAPTSPVSIPSSPPRPERTPKSPQRVLDRQLQPVSPTLPTRTAALAAARERDQRITRLDQADANERVDAVDDRRRREANGGESSSAPLEKVDPTRPRPRVELAFSSSSNRLLRSLLPLLSFGDVLALQYTSKTIKGAFESEKELVLERFLGAQGYRPYTPKTDGPSRRTFVPPEELVNLDLRDLRWFRAGLAIPLDEYARWSRAYVSGRLAPSTLKIARSTTRAWNRVVLRLRSQSLLPPTSFAPPLFPELRVVRQPVYKNLRAPSLRVWVPTSKGESWMNDGEIVECERELWRSGRGVWGQLRQGDVVSNVAIESFGNCGRTIFDGRFLRDLSFNFDVIGHLPNWLNMLSFSPSYFHNILASSTPNPVFYLALHPFVDQLRQTLKLESERVSLSSPQGKYQVKKPVYRGTIEIQPGQIVGTAAGVGGQGPGGIEVCHPEWAGRVSFETEGTSEYAQLLIARVASVEPTPWRIIRERCRPGRLYLRPVLTA